MYRDYCGDTRSLDYSSHSRVGCRPNLIVITCYQNLHDNLRVLGKEEGTIFFGGYIGIIFPHSLLTLNPRPYVVFLYSLLRSSKTIASNRRSRIKFLDTWSLN